MSIRVLFLLILSLVSVSTFAKPSMTIVYYDSFPPYSFRDENGNMAGIFIDIADQVLQETMGIPIIHKGYPWARAQRMVELGEADAFITVATQARQEYTNVSSTPVIVGPMNLFVNPTNRNLTQIEHVQTTDDLSPFLILDYQGNNWGNQHFPEDKFRRLLTSNLSNALTMLAHGRGDVIATDKIVADYLMAQLNLQGLIVELPIILAEVEFSLCIGKSSPFNTLLPEFNRQMALFRLQGHIETVLANYR
ncbi:transporter substrate-binding domain-containing protein [Vibrio sp. V33_P6A3T137]|uniref:substrate-binding periplasmic protein n=1 Tax=Vibrio sp. V33_P6A3T137 TaxID=1938685 RepID=UPI0013726B29|nr:transporter substrate-binding domain-containing protein [Vibrio sp. V33_P6A3T137]NAW78386.1 transporter substrate-binding domain-containing protein [Vibrio sp. V33_P6A3T137]